VRGVRTGGVSDDPHVYAGTKVLRNKFDILDAAELAYQERFFATWRGKAGVPSGDFDLSHLQAIHRHLFQDVCDWAGELLGDRRDALVYRQRRLGSVARRCDSCN
jgi:fido (protein-threonine AMPylation protein)